MKSERKCQPEPNQTSQQAITSLYEGWAAAREAALRHESPRPDWLETMPSAFQEGWELFNQPSTQTKLLRVGLLN